MTGWQDRSRLTVLIAVTLGVLAACRSDPPRTDLVAAEPAVVLIEDRHHPDNGLLVVTGLGESLLEALRSHVSDDAQWPQVFAVYTGAEPPAADARPAILGSYEIDGEALSFRPRFPWVPGLTYVARLRLAPLTGAADWIEVFTPGGEPAPGATRVTHIYPSSDELPANLLKLYLHFSTAMSRGEAYERLRLVDDDSGEEVVEPFVPIPQELWDPQRRRLTLFLDPGRIKRGIAPHDEVGPALTAGRGYRLIVDRDWRDARGSPLAEAFEKTFRVVGADRTSPDPSTWTITTPAAGSREPLILRFGEALDQALLERLIHIESVTRGQLDGDIEIDLDETVWRFRPVAPWVVGDYVVAIDKTLEDVAGNSLSRIFDIDTRAAPADQEVGRGDLPKVPLLLPVTITTADGARAAAAHRGE